MPTVFKHSSTDFFDTQMRRFDRLGAKSRKAEAVSPKEETVQRVETQAERKRKQMADIFANVGDGASLPIKTVKRSSPKTKRKEETDEDLLTAGLVGGY